MQNKFNAVVVHTLYLVLCESSFLSEIAHVPLECILFYMNYFLLFSGGKGLVISIKAIFILLHIYSKYYLVFFVSLYCTLQVSTYKHDIVFLKVKNFFYLSKDQPIDPNPALNSKP